MKKAARWLAIGAGLVASTYCAYVGATWYRYGRNRTSAGDDALLNKVLPDFDVAERHQIQIHAPADLVMSTAVHSELDQSFAVQAIFRSRELIFGGQPAPLPRPQGLLAQMKSIGWEVLAEIPEREIVMGAVTQPWVAKPFFRGLPPSEFVAFRDPGYVKIAWTLRVDPVDGSRSTFRTETRVATTDPESRSKFRNYWAVFSPGILLIRWFLLRQVKADAEWDARGRLPRNTGPNASWPQSG